MKMMFVVACLSLLFTGANLSLSLAKTLKDRTELACRSQQVIFIDRMVGELK